MHAGIATSKEQRQNELIEEMLIYIQSLEETLKALALDTSSESLQEKLDLTIIEYNTLVDQATQVRTERDTLNEVVRMFASRGRYNPNGGIYGRTQESSGTS